MSQRLTHMLIMTNTLQFISHYITHLCIIVYTIEYNISITEYHIIIPMPENIILYTLRYITLNGILFSHWLNTHQIDLNFILAGYHQHEKI